MLWATIEDDYHPVVQPVTAYIGLGSNVGDRATNIKIALREIDNDLCKVVRVSTLLENPAVGMGDDAEPFLNAAAELSTTLSPMELLQHLMNVEATLGRTRAETWTPRTIDSDLLLYGSVVHDDPRVTIPHPRMSERRFVLQPLAEIAPSVVHPVLKMTIAELSRRSQGD